MKYIVYTLIAVFFVACSSNSEEEKAEQVIEDFISRTETGYTSIEIKIDTLFSDYRKENEYIRCQRLIDSNNARYERYKKLEPHFDDDIMLEHKTVKRMEDSIKHYTKVSIALLKQQNIFVNNYKRYPVGWIVYYSYITDAMPKNLMQFNFDRNFTKILDTTRLRTN